VGKSSLLNRLLGEERMIVSNTPGTTRDTIDTRVEWRDKKFLFMDTAGLRAKKSKAVGLEGLTRIMSERAVDRCDVALLLLDAAEGLLEGDTSVGLLIQEKNRACVVGVNKWDVVQDKSRVAQWFRDRQPTDMPFLSYSSVVFLSAKTGYNVSDLLESVWSAYRQFHRRFEKEDLEAFFWAEVQNRPFTHRGRKLRFLSAEQAGTAPPTIVVRTNMPSEDIHFSYIRHMESAFRQRYQVASTPILLRFRKK
ncbi:MAG: 50S ribosome-binding GTPase, partial [Elusimicrobia bacterium]|nr:50S ribosome-binding GTPase [Elusimicrobiota bacterium]